MQTNLRDHRILFNVDCNYLFHSYIANNRGAKDGSRFKAAAIHRYVDLLADNGVDTFLINPNGQVAWYPSKVMPKVWDGYQRGDKKFFYGQILGQPMTKPQLEQYLDRLVRMMNRYLDFVEDGVDWVAEAIQACRRRKIAPWVSVRMNDLHGANNHEGSFMRHAQAVEPFAAFFLAPQRSQWVESQGAPSMWLLGTHAPKP